MIEFKPQLVQIYQCCLNLRTEKTRVQAHLGLGSRICPANYFTASDRQNLQGMEGFFVVVTCSEPARMSALPSLPYRCFMTYHCLSLLIRCEGAFARKRCVPRSEDRARGRFSHSSGMWKARCPLYTSTVRSVSRGKYNREKAQQTNFTYCI